jgi:hypothetical protein
MMTAEWLPGIAVSLGSARETEDEQHPDWRCNGESRRARLGGDHGRFRLLRALLADPPIRDRWRSAAGLRITHGIGWPKALAISLLGLAVFFAMFLAFMR